MNFRSTTFALVLALLACGVVASIWMRSGDRGRATAVSSATGAEEEQTEASLQGAPRERVTDRSAVASPEAKVQGTRAKPVELPEPAASLPQAAGDVVLSGVAVRVAANGEESSSDDGHLRLVQRQGAEIVETQVEVLGGRWTASVSPDASLYFSQVRLAGVPVTLETDDFAVPAERFLTLRGRERLPVLLHVLSAATAEPLDDVEVWLEGGATRGTRHPGVDPAAEPGAEPLASGSSPLEVRPDALSWRASAQLYVRAPGYAWGTIHLDHEVGGERTLRLPGACTLEVELVGSAVWLEPKVRLWAPDASKWAGRSSAERAPDAEDRAVFEALEPGVVKVSVERGWAHQRVSYGSAEVELVAGDHLRVPVQITLPEQPTPTRAAGVLTVPATWERDGLKLVVSGTEGNTIWMPEAVSRDVPELTALGPERLAFEFELPTAGEYLFEVEPLLVRNLVAIPEDGLTGIELAVPPPADVEVQVVDAATGDELFVEKLYWSASAVEGVTGTWLYPAYPDGAAGRVVFRAPAGEVKLAPDGQSLDPVDDESLFELAPGSNSLTWPVHRQLGVRFLFLDGDAAVPWTWDWRLRADQVGGEARDVGRSIGMLWFREPGTYELSSQGLPGYESIDGTRFDVLPGGEEQLVEVELVPLPR